MEKCEREELLRDMATAYLNYEDDGSAEVMGRVQAAMQAALSVVEKYYRLTRQPVSTRDSEV